MIRSSSIAHPPVCLFMFVFPFFFHPHLHLFDTQQVLSSFFVAAHTYARLIFADLRYFVVASRSLIVPPGFLIL